LQIIERDSTQIWAQYKLGTIWLKQKRFDEAIDAFRDTLKIDPNFPGSYKNIIQSFLQQQKWDEAIATCRAVIALVQEYPWVYSQLGNILAKKGETEEAIACFQKASELRGWHLCGEKGYRFSQDNFTNKIPIWESCLETLASRPGIKALEIGSFQGMSACWLLDRILTDSSATLTCIDTKFSEQFELNLAKTGASDKLNKLAGPLYKQLLSLESNDYDLINIQNRGKTPERVKQNIAVCWQLLKIGGIIIFKDYEGNDDRSLEESPQAGIKAFCDTVKEQFEILHQSHQLLVRKIAS
jgi:tetratricopeptide (TPR) repeat protein